jgi:hypothetical protein
MAFPFEDEEENEDENKKVRFRPDRRWNKQSGGGLCGKVF